ncbi:DUF3653 domain-containing protein [Vibrio agarivorans]|uniref:DUF3653 domain-containing protein n=1 Tax=Vibrio agarivorans TaxID=153622 RepID=UPI0022305343|nr:DUF3653 domain-containing protein [Vibrio agarivorans]
MYSNREISLSEDWAGFYCEQGKLVLPSGVRLTAAQILMASALVEIASDNDLKTATCLLKIARALQQIKPRHYKG